MGDIVEIGKEIVKNKDTMNEIYKDAIQPTAKAVGSIVALPFQIIDAALTKPKQWVAKQEFNYERTLKTLSEKMKNVPSENIVPPENYVAVPALQQIAYCFDSEELRNMYANLLASSMQKDKKWDVHPGFVDIIKQLSPDEAKIIKSLFGITDGVAIITLIAKNNNPDKGEMEVVTNFSLISYKAKCEVPLNIGVYIDNLCRLGLLKNTVGVSFLINEKKYEEIYACDYIKEQIKLIEKRTDGYNKPEYNKGCIELTDYGNTFCKVCIMD